MDFRSVFATINHAHDISCDNNQSISQELSSLKNSTHAFGDHHIDDSNPDDYTLLDISNSVVSRTDAVSHENTANVSNDNKLMFHDVTSCL